MKCAHSIQLIKEDLSGIEFQEHLDQCPQCSTLLEQVNGSMLFLDEPIDLPPGLLDKILDHTKLEIGERSKKRDLSLFFQFSTVAAAAIVLGIMLGFHANTQILFSKNSKKNEALIQLKEIHHLNVDHEKLF